MTTHVDVINVMLAGFPSQADKFGKHNMEVYVRLLKDIPVGELEAVVVQLMADGGDFIPSISAIRNKWRELSHDISQPTAPEAWETVMKEVRRIGSYGTPNFDCEPVAATVRQMGWRDICLSEKPDVVRAQFERMYNQNVSRSDQRAKLLPEVRRAIEAGAIRGPQQIGAIVRQIVDKEQ